MYGGPVGCGACAAVIKPLDNAEPQITAAEAVGTKVDSTTCELYGIILGLQTAIQYCGSNTNSNYPERLFVLCDSLQAVNFVIEASEHWRKPEWLKKLMALQEELLVINVSVHLAWIPGGLFTKGRKGWSVIRPIVRLVCDHSWYSRNKSHVRSS